MSTFRVLASSLSLTSYQRRLSNLASFPRAFLFEYFWLRQVQRVAANGGKVDFSKCCVTASGCCESECGLPCCLDVDVIGAVRFSVVPSVVVGFTLISCLNCWLIFCRFCCVVSVQVLLFSPLMLLLVCLVTLVAIFAANTQVGF